MEASLANYMERLQKKSQELRKQGQELYVAIFSSIKKFIPLRHIDRMSKRDGSLEIIYDDINYIKEFFPGVNSKNCLDVKIFPYKKPDSVDDIDSSDLENMLELEI